MTSLNMVHTLNSAKLAKSIVSNQKMRNVKNN